MLFTWTFIHPFEPPSSCVISEELIRAWAAGVGAVRESRPKAFNAENPCTNVNFLSKERRVNVCAWVLRCRGASRSRPLVTHRRRAQIPRLERTEPPMLAPPPYAICTRRLYTSRPKSRHSSEKSIVSVWSAAVA